MSNIVLSAGVRQNLLSLQTTAQLMSTTQNRLATGKKVNSALDNPSNFFTSQSLSNRASDLNALLDSIGQAQQTLTPGIPFWVVENGMCNLVRKGRSYPRLDGWVEEALKSNTDLRKADADLERSRAALREARTRR